MDLDSRLRTHARSLAHGSGKRSSQEIPDRNACLPRAGQTRTGDVSDESDSSAVEELSGKTFEYEEILPAFENYIPDKKAADVSAETRALADVYLLLFNSHAFVYLD